MRTASEAAVQFGPWQVETPTEMRALVEMPSWDYGMELVFVSDVSVDAPRAAAECGLELDAGTEFVWVVVAECGATYWRETSIATVTSRRQRVAIIIPPGTVARAVRLSRRIVVARSSWEVEPLAPKRGHIIAGAQDSTTVVLEGEGGRFPTRALSFNDIGFPDAPWHLSLSYDDPTDAFAGSVQLYLNTDDKRVEELVGPDPDPDLVTSLQKHLEFDLARQLVLHAVSDERLNAQAGWEEDSVGAVLEAVCARTSRRNAAGCRAAHRQDLHLFETEVKANLGFLP